MKKKKTNSCCPYCTNVKRTMLHLFISCAMAKSFSGVFNHSIKWLISFSSRYNITKYILIIALQRFSVQDYLKRSLDKVSNTLYGMKKKKTNSCCPYCTNVKRTMLHLFISCAMAKSFSGVFNHSIKWLISFSSRYNITKYILIIALQRFSVQDYLKRSLDKVSNTLYEMKKKKKNSCCPYCTNVKRTMLHLFISCAMAKSFSGVFNHSIKWLMSLWPNKIGTLSEI